MPDLPVVALASRHAQWASVRQSAVASNIANINTPGYQKLAVAPFQDVLEGNNSANTLAVTNVSHISDNPSGGPDAVQPQVTEEKVNLEDQLVEQNDLRKSYELNTAVVKAFHRMFLSVARP